MRGYGSFPLPGGPPLCIFTKEKFLMALKWLGPQLEWTWNNEIWHLRSLYASLINRAIIIENVKWKDNKRQTSVTYNHKNLAIITECMHHFHAYYRKHNYLQSLAKCASFYSNYMSIIKHDTNSQRELKMLLSIADIM